MDQVIARKIAKRCLRRLVAPKLPTEVDKREKLANRAGISLSEINLMFRGQLDLTRERMEQLDKHIPISRREWKVINSCFEKIETEMPRRLERPEGRALPASL